MCFSAEASFIGGSALTAIGILSVRKNREPDQRLFAAMPLVFGVQQIAEGFVWTALKSEQKDLMLKLSAYAFLVVALLIWPSFVPLSVRLMETDRRRKTFLNILTALGVVTSLSYLAGFLIYEVTVRIDYMHIDYGVNAPQQFLKIAYLAYLAVTLLPFLITSKRKVWLLGAVIVVSYAVAAYFYSEYLLSVWCFFAAITSAVVWWIVGEARVTSRQQVQAS
ncbi:hypothetical protein EOM86_10210 [Candidatus Nomurabacteria bacterium]|nr:hypothetical protein [Candidatus Nomurabacteria bacterium]